MCGEQAIKAASAASMEGSPPRVRGTVFYANHGHKAKGITPACAGNSTGVCVTFAICGDHPRVCGEQGQAGSLTAPMEGSPPRVRGTGYGGGPRPRP